MRLEQSREILRTSYFLRERLTVVTTAANTVRFVFVSSALHRIYSIALSVSLLKLPHNISTMAPSQDNDSDYEEEEEEEEEEDSQEEEEEEEYSEEEDDEDEDASDLSDEESVRTIFARHVRRRRLARTRLSLLWYLRYGQCRKVCRIQQVVLQWHVFSFGTSSRQDSQSSSAIASRQSTGRYGTRVL